MAFQREVGGSAAQATDYRDLLTKLVQFSCSQHVATVAVNNGGTGGTYVVGDIVELQHASAHLYARFEVTTVSGGQITGLRIVDSGAYAQQATSATVSAGGSGYAVGDILQVQGGSSRMPAKFQVATLSGSAVATVSLFEGGGVYSSTPSNPAATVGVGPSTFAGNDACTLTVTYQSIVGTTGLAVTGGGGTGATVDITLAETGWAVDDRDTNDRLYNSVDGEKEVCLVGDAAGKTNKPYIGFGTFTEDDGVNDRYIVTIYGMTSHNPLLDFDQSNQFLGSPGAWGQSRPYILCSENQVQNMDFWFSADDLRVCGVVNINPGAANTDDGEYMHFYAGFVDTFATETEDPYPMYIFASGRTPNIDPSASTANITGLSELLAPSGQSIGSYFYDVQASGWQQVRNSQNTANQLQDTVMSPCCRIREINGSTDADNIVSDNVIRYDNGVGSTNRSSPSRRLRPVPGTTDLHFPFPLTIVHRPGGSALNANEDRPIGQLRGCFWVYNTDDTGSTITNFSEDYITIGSDRYRVFHTHVQRQLYHYIALKEDV